MHTTKRLIVLCFVLLGSLACNIAQFVPTRSVDTPTATEASVGGVISAPTLAPTQEPAQPLTTASLTVLDPCTLLSPTEATDVLGEVVGPAKVNGGSCTYADAASGVHVLSAYAFQGEQARNQWGVRLFLLSAFGLRIDQPTVDEIKAWDEAGNEKAILEKIGALSADNTAFTSRTLDGLGEIAYWAWKDLGYGARQGFLIAVKGDIIVGTDIVHGENMDEKAAVDSAMQVVSRIFERLPERFTVDLAVPPTQAVVATATPVPAPTLVPSATLAPTFPSLPTPTRVGDTGKRIAFESNQDGSQQIYTMTLEGWDFQCLTYTGANFAPAWSPDGKQIAFYSIRGQSAGLYVMNADGSGERMIFDSAYISGGPGWSPDGSRIAFVSNRDGNLEIYGIGLDGSGLVNVTNNPAQDHDPAWSPDGGRIAFASDRGSGITEVWVMKADGSAAAQITHLGTVAQEPAWSPNGQLLAFVGAVPGHYGQIFSIGVDGAGLVNLTNNDMDNHAPEWIPNGALIVFYAAPYKGNWDIYRINHNGKNLINLTQGHQTTQESFPDWQP